MATSQNKRYDACKGEYYSEIFTLTSDTSYKHWLEECMAALKSKLKKGYLDVSEIVLIGKKLQTIDVKASTPRINNKPDALHQLWGSNSDHPYRKLTLIGTMCKVKIGDELHDFLYEKFLTIYSYLDKDVRRSTTTPLHTHPINQEVVYFLSYGPKSCVVETEYEYWCENQLIDLNTANGRTKFATLTEAKIELKKKNTQTILPSDKPIILEPFDSELLLYDDDLILAADGMFRPHQVTVYDDSKIPTLFYSINNYWSPTGKVNLYTADGKLAKIWNPEEWK